MRKTTITIERYEYNDYTVTVDRSGDCVDFWLCKNGYGIMEYMFGIPKESDPRPNVEGLILANVDEYITTYEERYCED